MKWGFGWELGPFEVWDAIGLEKSIHKIQEQNREVPDWVKEMLLKGHTSFYKEENGERYFYDHGEYHLVEDNPKVLNLEKIKESKGCYQEK